LGLQIRSKKYWDSYPNETNRMEIVKEKLKWLKRDIKQWNINNIASMAIKKQQIVKEVADLDLKEESCNLEEDMSATSECTERNIREEISVV